MSEFYAYQIDWFMGDESDPEDEKLKITSNPKKRKINTTSLDPNKGNSIGHRNISYDSYANKWRFEKQYNGVLHTKSGLKTLDDALKYKKEYLKTLPAGAVANKKEKANNNQDNTFFGS